MYSCKQQQQQQQQKYVYCIKAGRLTDSDWQTDRQTDRHTDSPERPEDRKALRQAEEQSDSELQWQKNNPLLSINHGLRSLSSLDNRELVLIRQIEGFIFLYFTFILTVAGVALLM